MNMYTDVPKLTRCCFCLPLRHGLLFWGYLKLLPLLGMFLLLILELTRFIGYQDSGATHSSLPPPIPILMTLTIVDIIFSVILLVGGHTKNWNLFKIYYYYSMTMVGLFVLCYSVFIIGFIVMSYSNPFLFYLLIYVIQIVLFGAAVLLLQIYITILVRSEMLKLRDNANFSFVNHAAEAQCTMNQDK
ncbi:uncharacterized protein LOC131841180, partial [Achroia grisella]